MYRKIFVSLFVVKLYIKVCSNADFAAILEA